MNIEFTGEYFIPGKSSNRLEADHFARYEFAAQFIKGKLVLDIACGVGYGSHLLSKAGAKVVHGVDINPEAIAYANQEYSSEITSFTCDDIYTYDPGSRYDVVVSFETIEHVDDYDKALSNLYRLLRDKGQLVISSPNRPITSPGARSLHDKPNNIHHVREFNLDELKSALISHGFVVRPENVYGQRQQQHYNHAALNYLYKLLFKPKRRADPTVTPIRNLTPRYLVIVADKIGAHESAC